MPFIGVPRAGLLQVSKKTIQRLEKLADRTGRLGKDILDEVYQNGEETEETLIKYLDQEEGKLR